MTETETLLGWKEICTYLGGLSEPTVRRLAIHEGLPITSVAGRPMTTRTALSDWVSKRCQERRWGQGRKGAKRGDIEKE